MAFSRCFLGERGLGCRLRVCGCSQRDLTQENSRNERSDHDESGEEEGRGDGVGKRGGDRTLEWFAELCDSSRALGEIGCFDSGGHVDPGQVGAEVGVELSVQHGAENREAEGASDGSEEVDRCGSGTEAGLNTMLNELLWKGQLDPRLRELIIMRIGWATDAVYEWTQHWRVARMLDIPERDLLAVRDWRNHDDFGDAERAVLAATDETLETGTISDDTWATCRNVFDNDAILVEMVAAIGNWRLFSALLKSLDVPLEDGVEPWPPNGVAAWRSSGWCSWHWSSGSVGAVCGCQEIGDGAGEGVVVVASDHVSGSSDVDIGSVGEAFAEFFCDVVGDQI